MFLEFPWNSYMNFLRKAANIFIEQLPDLPLKPDTFERFPEFSQETYLF